MRTIKLKEGAMGRFDDESPFLIGADPLELKFLLPQKVGDFYLTWRIEDVTQRTTCLIPKNGEVAIDCAASGRLEMQVKHYISGELVGMYKVESLLLKKVDDSISASPEIAELQREMSLLQKEVSWQKETLAKFLKGFDFI